MTKASEFPVFHDPLGRRWQRVRRIWAIRGPIVGWGELERKATVEAGP